MSDSKSYNSLERSTPDERRSGWVFAAALGLVLFAVAFPDLPPERLLGVLWAGLGLLMLAAPPRTRLPWGWFLLAAGFVISLCLGFLPKSWAALPVWRSDLESLGLETGSQIAVQPFLTVETAAGFAVTAIATLYLMGHRVSTKIHHGLAITFAALVALCAAVAMSIHEPGRVFGLFPNRNHTATLLVMGAVAGLACLVQAIRFRSGWKIAFSVISAGCILYALFTHNISRAGIVLLAVATSAWLLLMGRRFLGGHTGKAIALIAGVLIAAFLILDSQVKTRLTETVERIQSLPPAEAPASPFGEAATTDPNVSVDARVSIFEDALTMIRREPWTGIGAGHFRFLSYQYRDRTSAPATSITLHPESDWLWLTAESGILSTVCLAAAVVWAGVYATTGARRGRGRALRAGCIVAAFVVPFHGLFDVPGHRVGIAWAAALLLALSLRPRPDSSPDSRKELSLPAGAWRMGGALVLITALLFLHADSIQRPMLASAKVAALMADAKSLYDIDKAAYDLAKAEGRDYQPAPDQDPLELALEKVETAIRITPLDSHLHYVHGALALHFDDKQAAVDQAFAIQRRLVPIRVDIPLEQARAWAPSDPARAKTLWQEALRRSPPDGSRRAEMDGDRQKTYEKILATAATGETLAEAALDLAGDDADRIAAWARAVSPASVDRLMPGKLLSSGDPAARRGWLKIWSGRGSKATVDAFATAHPQLGGP